MNSTAPSRPEPVLIVSQGDGTFDVHGSNINVHIVTAPYVGEPDPTPLVEDYVEANLSQYWRKLYYPGYVKATGCTKPLLPSKLAEADAVETLMRELQRTNLTASTRHRRAVPKKQAANTASNVSAETSSSTLASTEGAA